jgi:hypothetical protein
MLQQCRNISKRKTGEGSEWVAALSENGTVEETIWQYREKFPRLS